MKILVVLSRIPFPLEKGDKLRAYYQIRELSKWHDLYLVALYSRNVPEEAMRELTPYCREIHFLRQSPLRSVLNMAASLFVGLPLQCGYFYSHRNHKRIDKIIQGKSELVEQVVGSGETWLGNLDDEQLMGLLRFGSGR